MSDEFRDFVRTAMALADIARGIVLEQLGSAPPFEVKPDASPVTPFDKAVEDAQRKHLAKAHPEHGIVGEEYGQDRPEAEYVWVIDPIDGTKQFIAGLPVFGTLIALARHGKPVLGLVECPATRDRWIGGTGVPASWNGEPIATRACPTLAAAVSCAGTPTRGLEAEQAMIDAVNGETAWSNWGGGCFGFGLLAAGRHDLMIDNNLNSHDFMAPTAVIEAAGGVVTDWTGAPLTIESDGHFLAAGDPALHAAALARLRALQGS